MEEKYIINTLCGALEGEKDGKTLAFRGIPYALPPTGARRFHSAVQIQGWDGVLNAKRFGKAAVQREKKHIEMSEDCLFLNIWTPAPNGKKRPVLFYMHGGSFVAGSGAEEAACGANIAAAQDVVAVTLNYRLGALGFMDFSFLSEEFSPNCGITDALEALRWLKRNVGFFGGDPDNITVFGQSAGGTIAITLAGMDAAKGLVSKVIAMSGGPTLLVDKEKYMETSKAFLDYAGIKTKEELLAIPAEKLVSFQKGFCSEHGLGAGTFTISVDGEIVKRHPIIAAAKGETSGVPMLLGTTREEMSFYFIKPLAKKLDIDGIFQGGVNVEDEDTRTAMIKAYDNCYGKSARSVMLADLVFRIGCVWLAQTHGAHTNTWMYRFDYETAAMRVSKLHAFHSSDVPFVFGNFRKGLGKLMFIFTPSLKRAKRLSAEMQRDFAAFARNGVLEWEKCGEGRAIAKCYNKTSKTEPAVAQEVERAYNRTKFKQRSFSGSGIGF